MNSRSAWARPSTGRTSISSTASAWNRRSTWRWSGCCGRSAADLAFSHARDDLDGDVFGRIYGARQRDLLREYREAGDRQDADPERIEHAEWQAFTYWLFRRRLERQDPARVASDTRQGLEMLYELEAAKQRRHRRHAAASERAPDATDVIDGVLVAVG